MDSRRKLNILLLATIGAVTIASLILFLYEKKQHNPEYQKSWAAFSFIDPNNPQKGIRIDNYLGEKTKFLMCVVPDNNDITEPNQLTCDMEQAYSKEDITVEEGASKTWDIPLVFEKKKHWVVLEYEKVGKRETKALSFQK